VSDTGLAKLLEVLEDNLAERPAATNRNIFQIAVNRERLLGTANQAMRPWARANSAWSPNVWEFGTPQRVSRIGPYYNGNFHSV
jgi:hypothetical protein